LKGRTFGDTEFVIGHSGSTVPERSGVALSFCGRPSYTADRVDFLDFNQCRRLFSAIRILRLIAPGSTRDSKVFEQSVG